ncbi:MAG: hypothetical protein ACOYL6_17245 [Bacteriovoracaceae bacterium]
MSTLTDLWRIKQNLLWGSGSQKTTLIQLFWKRYRGYFQRKLTYLTYDLLEFFLLALNLDQRYFQTLLSLFIVQTILSLVQESMLLINRRLIGRGKLIGSAVTISTTIFCYLLIVSLVITSIEQHLFSTLVIYLISLKIIVLSIQTIVFQKTFLIQSFKRVYFPPKKLYLPLIGAVCFSVLSVYFLSDIVLVVVQALLFNLGRFVVEINFLNKMLSQQSLLFVRYSQKLIKLKTSAKDYYQEFLIVLLPYLELALVCYIWDKKFEWAKFISLLFIYRVVTRFYKSLQLDFSNLRQRRNKSGLKYLLTLSFMVSLLVMSIILVQTLSYSGFNGRSITFVSLIFSITYLSSLFYFYEGLDILPDSAYHLRSLLFVILTGAMFFKLDLVSNNLMFSFYLILLLFLLTSKRKLLPAKPLDNFFWLHIKPQTTIKNSLELLLNVNKENEIKFHRMMGRNLALVSSKFYMEDEVRNLLLLKIPWDYRNVEVATVQDDLLFNESNPNESLKKLKLYLDKNAEFKNGAMDILLFHQGKIVNARYDLELNLFLGSIESKQKNNITQLQERALFKLNQKKYYSILISFETMIVLRSDDFNRKQLEILDRIKINHILAYYKSKL